MVIEKIVTGVIKTDKTKEDDPKELKELREQERSLRLKMEDAYAKLHEHETNPKKPNGRLNLLELDEEDPENKARRLKLAHQKALDSLADFLFKK